MDMGCQKEKNSSFINIGDPDLPIYRIFSVWAFQEAVRLRQLVLVTPTRWEDPHEDLATGAMLNIPTEEGLPQTPLAKYLKPVYAQCWSMTEESDALLRTYSRVLRHPIFSRNTYPGEEGVRVRSTPRKLMSAIGSWASDHPGFSCFVGAVQYAAEQKIGQKLANAIGDHRASLLSLGCGRSRAELLLMKRNAFSHENEVRLVCVDNREAPESIEMVRIQVDPSFVFDQVMFDPRLETFERRERESIIREAGYTGELAESRLYQRMNCEIDFQNGWND
jgi:hypothetical protein